MNIDSYKYIDINGVSIAYMDSGQGKTILFVHGFASFSFTWQKMLESFPENIRTISIDLKGYGYSEKICDDALSPFDQSGILAEFIKKLDLKDISLVAHSMGGAISLLSLFNPEIEARVNKLVLIDTAGLFQKIPDFIDDLTAMSPHNPLIRLTDENLIAKMVLEQTYFDRKKITEDVIKAYADVFRQKNAKECLICSAKQIAIANIRSFHKKMAALKLPVLLIWGEEDRIIDLEDAFLFFHNLNKAKLKIIPECGHNPQEEQAHQTAEIIGKFLNIEIQEKILPGQEEADNATASQASNTEEDKNYKLKMSRLFDYWSPGTITLMLFIKFLQLLKKIGFKAEEGGWRKATGIFLRKEHTKFILGVFRLHYFNKATLSPNLETSKKVVIKRLSKFLHNQPSCHWTNKAGFFMNKRKQIFFTDIIEAQFANDGRILNLIPHFDEMRPAFALLNPEMMAKAIKQIIFLCNKTSHLHDPKRARKVHKKLSLWVIFQYDLSRTGQHELKAFINRIMNATFIQFETLTADPESFLKQRLATPNTKYSRHPGFGLLNISCRFTNNLGEADLWFQYHHVPVDGMPMQEMLHELKKEWGSCGQIQYPALSSPDAEMELYDLGRNICRARMYTCLDDFLSLRKKVNEKYYSEMGGPATVASMLIWALSQHPDLRKRKFLFPVDTSLLVDYPQDRSISLVIIRPGKFFDDSKPGKGFLEFQREFNRHLFATRLGKSEAFELLELYAMIHPLFYYFAGKVMPKAMGELIGSAGITVLRDAEMFICPMTDVHFNGFIAIGNMKMPTVDGKNACAVSFCGKKERVLQYAEAINNLSKYCENLLDD